MSYLIYKHTNKINGKVYIGQTCRAQDPNLRWMNGKGYSKCRKFYNAIQKYGWDNFDHEILMEVKSAKEADLLEIKFIEDYNAIKLGYNITKGGAGRHIYRPVYQLDLNLNIINYFDSAVEAAIALNLPIYHNHIVECCKKLQRTTGGYCWCYVDEYNSYKLKPRVKSSEKITKPIYQLSKDKTIIAKFPSALKAYKTITNNKNAKSATIISECCKGTRSNAFGFFWCYAEDYDTYEIKLSYYQKKVLQIDLITDKPIAMYNNLAAAAKAVDTTSSKIGLVCNGHRNKTKNYKWKFASIKEEEIYKNLLIEV